MTTGAPAMAGALRRNLQQARDTRLDLAGADMWATAEESRENVLADRHDIGDDAWWAAYVLRIQAAADVFPDRWTRAWAVARSRR